MFKKIVLLVAIFSILGVSFYNLSFSKATIRPDMDSIINPLIQATKSSYDVKEKFTVINSAYAKDLDIDPNAYVVVDFDSGEAIAEKNMEKALPIASVTKIMTAVVALDLAKPNDLITISANAASQVPTKIGVVPGEKMSLTELLDAMLLTSANDAAQAIKDGVDQKYNDKVFIKAMNNKAKFLGLTNTSFANPQGFDSRKNFSSAKDLAILSHYALVNYPLIGEIVNKDYVFLPANTNHKQFDLQNWNGLIGVYPGADGIKIGNTRAAGKTTIVTAQREGKKILVVVLGAPGIVERDLWAAELLDYGFEKTLGLPKISVTRQQLLDKYAKWQYWN